MPASHVPDTSRGKQPDRGGPPARSRALALAILVLALAGAGLAAELTLLHGRAHAGGASSFCAISERVNCDKVALSAWSSLLGVPLAAWGLLAYLVVAALALSALRRPRGDSGWPAGLLFAASAFMAAGAVFLAAISELVIGSLCIVCAGSWLVSFALAGCSFALARRAGGPAAALRADVATLRARPLASATAALALLAASGGLLARYAGPPPAPAGAPAAAPAASLGPPGSIVLYEYSDYECPFCARSHEANKPILASRPDVKVVRRHFPLDDTCNPKLTRPFHVGACDLARAAICAEAQGRFEQMDDALFRNQAEKAPVRELARRIGLDLPRFDACLSSPGTEKRLADDIESAIQAGVRGTPSYVYGGKVYPGDLATLLGAKPAAASGG
ncbi:Vitamin K epoxide reductase [Anaeromyxobacter sp. K]|uniref:vitamin K epoxide reductase/DsbA family protein n=1 Tax=Anaeromyxobacter sp. (strain K) TaxID=447217 RepID=UPI00015F9F5C|nr:vitamin K epoxide reductase family protein [Anaeromyxobacter sp. K]ACG71777.1 Vitamin K epoxide reductase [Anaeromyxobacter sp. K]